MTRYELHVRNWKHCDRCESARTRHQVCLLRGTIPCDVLFIGEAPGESEDTLGRPFVGPAGILLNSIVSRAIGNRATVAFTNLVGCIPVEDGTNKATEPSDESIEACAPRLQEIVKIASPRLIVCVGKLASVKVGEDSLWLKGRIELTDNKGGSIKTVTITHPAAMLRTPFAARGLSIQRAVAIINQAVEEIQRASVK